MVLNNLIEFMQSLGADKIYIKFLSPNDNSKNQIYFGGNFRSLNIIPYGDLSSEQSSRGTILKAPVEFYWISEYQSVHRAPNSQLILYPQYPEVRFSGFLAGCENAPSNKIATRGHNRILFLGVTRDGKTYGYVAEEDELIANETRSLKDLWQIGVFSKLSVISENDSKSILLSKLLEIHKKGWINSRRLQSDGSEVPCRSSNCGGYTLETEFGITPNGYAKPDYIGWEIKQHSVRDINKPESGVVTLFTPEPNDGYYCDAGVEKFIHKYGYPDKLGRKDRMNFGGIHKVNYKHPTTCLTMGLPGYQVRDKKLVNSDEGVTLFDEYGNEAAKWNYSGLMKHWKRKHSQAVYIPSNMRKRPGIQYRYGSIIHLGEGTDFSLFLEAMSIGAIYYDPGIKLENISTNPKIKRRSQFRIKVKNLDALYDSFTQVDLNRL